jgi:hypothetical protein
MRDSWGAHVSHIDEYGHQVDLDDVHTSMRVHGSFAVRYYANADRTVITVGTNACSEMRMQLPLDQAIVLRELLDAGITDALAATVVELPTGGVA